MFAPNGMRVLAGLGLANKMLESGNFMEVPCINMYDSKGGLLGKVPGGSKERFEYTSVMTLRTEILEILMEDAEKRGIEVRYGAKVKSLQESDDGVVVGWKENDEDKELKADLVVGADGIWSVVRKR
jgi:2-polyprenyl-6-methoxyphenol hydroxylase-like FAD-dependent oxidoreductase